MKTFKFLINYLVSFFVAQKQPTNHLAVLEHYERMIAANRKQQVIWDRLDRYADLEWHSNSNMNK